MRVAPDMTYVLRRTIEQRKKSSTITTEEIAEEYRKVREYNQKEAEHKAEQVRRFHEFVKRDFQRITKLFKK